MNVILLSSRLALTLVFGVAGVAKLRDRAGSRRSLREFGVPRFLTSPLAFLLPLVELASAAALLPAASAWWGATGAGALLALFSVAIIVNLARGRTPDCHCFGKLHSEPVGWGTVARNLVLAVPAAFVVWSGPEHAGPGFVGWLASLGRTDAMLLGLALALAVLSAFALTMLVQVLAQNGRLLLRIEAIEAKVGREEPALAAAGLAVNTVAPVFSLSGLDELPVNLGALSAFGKPLLLFFTEPGCGACDAELPEVARWQHEYGERLLVVPISRGDVQVNRAKSIRHGLDHVLLQTDREVAEAYQVQVTPSAILIKDGVIAAPLAAGADAIRALVFNATLPPPVKKGDLAPSIELQDLNGKALNVAALRRTVLLFWNPSCGFCKAMLRELQSWERTRPKQAPSLVLVSSGSADANSEQRVRSRILLDPSFGAGQVFGANGTPSAVLIDEEGRVASDVGVGAPAVLALVGAVAVTA